LALNLTQIPKKEQTSNQFNNNVFENEFPSWSRQKHTHWLKVNRQFRGKLFVTFPSSFASFYIVSLNL